MNKKPIPQKLMQETNKFLHGSLRILKSLYQNLSTKSHSHPEFSLIKKQKEPNICMKKDAPSSGQTKVDVDIDQWRPKDLKREERPSNSKPSFRTLEKKMKELEMMDISDDRDHARDIEEILQSYSQISCPAYVEIVDKFFMDMYTELSVPLGSVNSSTRKVGSKSVYSSMRSLGPVKL